MYRLGFCIYGPACRYKHNKLPGAMGAGGVTFWHAQDGWSLLPHPAAPRSCSKGIACHLVPGAPFPSCLTGRAPFSSVSVHISYASPAPLGTLQEEAHDIAGGNAMGRALVLSQRRYTF